MLVPVLAQQYAPTRMLEVVMAPAMLVALGLVLWWAGILLEGRTEVRFVKWLGLVPIAIALYIGIRRVLYLSDPVYRNMIEAEGGKTIPGHYIALLLPILGAAIVGIWYVVYSKRDRRHEDF